MNHSLQQPSSVGSTRRIGIKWKMYAILIVFIGVIVGVIWFFQVQMLNYFYQLTRFNELELSATAISAELHAPEQLKEVTSEYASDYYVDIWVYGIFPDGHTYAMATAKGTGEAEIQNLSHKFETFYLKAKENNGRYIAMVPMEQFHNGFEVKVIKDNSDDASYPFVNHSGDICAVYVELYELDGKQFMIVQSTNLTPIRAMVKTFRNQSVWIAMILSAIALLMSWIMSRLITKPIVKMNDAAKKLAQGHYDANFVGYGYREIGELADTLNYASRELAKTDNLQKELISNISHDLRTPLTMIKGYSEVMRDIPGENTPENIQIIIDETSRLSELVNDMLDLSKIQAGTRNPEFQTFSLTSTVRDTMLRYERLTMQDGYRIEFVADCDVTVYADRGMILQVIYNLINNAINYTGDDKYVLVRQELTADSVRISVTDTGDGIPEDQLPMIWDRYYKVDKVHKRATVGTGLGLSIVKGILELHHATYGVQSTLGKGSVFWFELMMNSKESSMQSDIPDYIEADYEKQKTEE